MFAITSRVHHEFEEYTTQFQDKQSCQNESETVRSCHRKTATDPRSFRKDTRQCTTELPIRAIPPTISHEAERLLPLRFVEGSQMPAGANKRAEFPAALPKRKIQQNKSPRRNGPRSPASENKHVRTRRAGTSTAGRRGGTRTRRKLSARGGGRRHGAAGAGAGERGDAPLVLERDEREALGLHLLLLAYPAGGVSASSSAGWRWGLIWASAGVGVSGGGQAE